MRSRFWQSAALAPLLIPTTLQSAGRGDLTEAKGNGGRRGRAHAHACREMRSQPSCLPCLRGTQPNLNGASVISSRFIGAQLTSWKARTLHQVTAVFDPREVSPIYISTRNRTTVRTLALPRPPLRGCAWSWRSLVNLGAGGQFHLEGRTLAESCGDGFRLRAILMVRGSRPGRTKPIR
jgi:hypothetical protein